MNRILIVEAMRRGTQTVFDSMRRPVTRGQWDSSANAGLGGISGAVRVIYRQYDGD